MRVKFRIRIDLNGKRLKKEDLKGKRDPFSIALRYITEFKYLEATKWLYLAEDSYEKYYLLSLINEALGQEEQAKEFRETAKRFERKYEKLEISKEIPQVIH